MIGGGVIPRQLDRALIHPVVGRGSEDLQVQVAREKGPPVVQAHTPLRHVVAAGEARLKRAREPLP